MHFILSNAYRPTNSHVSAPSVEPMVTSKGSFVPVFCQGVFSWNRSEVFAYIIMFTLLGVIDVYLQAKLMAFLSRVCNYVYCWIMCARYNFLLTLQV